MNVCFLGTCVKMKIYMMHFYRQTFLLPVTSYEVNKGIYRPTVLLHTSGQAKLKDNKRDSGSTRYILLPLKCPLSVLSSSHEDKQKKYTEGCKQPLQSSQSFKHNGRQDQAPGSVDTCVLKLFTDVDVSVRVQTRTDTIFMKTNIHSRHMD